jgi:hypothetical protein
MAEGMIMYVTELFLPLDRGHGSEVPDEEIQEIVTMLADRFGGATAFTPAPALGLWKSGKTMAQDRIVIVEVMVDTLDVAWWSSCRAQLERRFLQDQVLIRAVRADVLRGVVGMVTRTGGCLCGDVRYKVRGKPLRVGLCHCSDCRKESGSSFVTFAVWPTRVFRSTGQVKIFRGRCFCPICGSRLFNLGKDETEIRVGSLDKAPTGLEPEYEIWVVRREKWLHPLAIPQYPGNRHLSGTETDPRQSADDR